MAEEEVTKDAGQEGDGCVAAAVRERQRQRRPRFVVPSLLQTKRPSAAMAILIPPPYRLVCPCAMCSLLRQLLRPE